ncbi:hypothetical protein ASG43_09915 [Aureimonas sp. Leaf454]|uniref:DUF3772 domain-containing protein n=1 Tax=Aureimonas sp. Leaf454 TaxID=1736381 RepID=UPI0006F36D50|nr:DUF3772 domain-containing protein [Aureimonas sp. Leaf454]KQT47427.1 hypothetical protein ASG43_09915 [Aureimonas sp. Leaf454]
MTIRTIPGGLLAALFFCVFLAIAPRGLAQEAVPNPVAVLDLQAEALKAISAEADRATTAEQKVDLRDRGIVVGTTANATVALLEPQLAQLDQRIAELGEPSEGEAGDVKAQRAELQGERDTVDSAIKRGRLLAADAKEMIDRMIREINVAFSRDTFQQVASPLSPRLWSDVADRFPDDWARFGDFVTDQVLRIPGEGTVQRYVVLLASLLAAWLLVGPARRRLRHMGRTFALQQTAGTRARRSALAVWFVVVGTATSALACLVLYLAMNWANILTRGTRPLAETMMITASIGAFIISLGAALLLVGQSSWRLLPISDEAARKLRSFPPLGALLTFLGVFLVEGGRSIGVSRAAAILGNYIVAFTYCGLIIAILVSLGRLRRSHPEDANREPNVRTTIVTLATILAWIAVAVSIGAALQGYVNIALFLSRQTIWTAIVASTAYLLLIVVDDLCTTFLSPNSRLGRSLHSGLGLRKSQVGQLGVVTSALLRIGILVLAALLLTGPLGPGATSLFYQFGSTAEISIGGVTLVPGAILKAVIALVVGILLMRAVRSWLDERYLPATDLDPGARNSVSTIVSYVGFILAGFWALTLLGIGVERIALVVSALSVGIGFGLQAITQNFISGLILLAERPVKIGDTVRIGTDEGDVKRISVRSTEIQIADRSTLIVPNSELITKSIRNMTLANPLGRIQINFAAPLDVDVAAVKAALLEVYAGHNAVLPEPAPSIFIDGIEGGQVAFKSFAFVSGPRAVYATRSAVLFSLLERLRKDGIPLVAQA